MSALFSSTYLFFLFIAPQLWYIPILDLRTDYYLYPCWALYSIISGNFRNFRFEAQTTFIILFFIWIGVANLVNHIPLTYADTLLKYSRHALVFFLFFISFNSLKQIKIFLSILCLLSIILSMEGIDHYTGSSGLGWANQPLGWAAFGQKGRTQWVGIFDGPGVFCVIYTIALPFFLLLTNSRQNIFKRIFGLLSTVLVFIAIFFNGSRGGFLTALSICAMIFGANYYKRNKVKCFLGIFLVIMIFLLSPSQLTSISDGQKSSSNRVDMWAEGTEMVFQNPLFGIGKGRFASYTGTLIAHNSAIEIMGETGIVGLFLWIGMIYFALIKLIRFMNDEQLPAFFRDSIVAPGLLISILGYIISSMFVTLEYETFYLLLGLCGFFGRQISSKIEVNMYHLKNIAYLTFGWILTIKVFVTLVLPSSLR